MSSTKDTKLDELELMKQERAKATKQPAPRPTPPVQDITINYVSPEGETKTVTLAIRILNRDEMLDVHRLAALYAGVDFDLLGQTGRDICYARALVEIMWRDGMPEWLKVAMSENEEYASQIAIAINNHRSAYFRGNYRASKEGQKPAGLEVVPIRPAPAREK